ncbi:hypothetical protein BAUCODRAFT_31467 [Baudoinia panamericana UAMH 10762]|uniref:Uncharacterized protein n=1 Tax=Baudoinia panamericana (strain UAMH 10762) TaxID=717646 RepID=M2MQR3_BAUPA|nr:uncharacterized protein BAUCODRAFT_31467 [Baudoinia panamericana UAMH 10762]EMC99151.1 hypothetical protein BAUCODRAFT_31467 [Baudoinia panamericana UAMH 10762]
MLENHVAHNAAAASLLGWEGVSLAQAGRLAQSHWKRRPRFSELESDMHSKNLLADSTRALVG